jgi:mannosyltransferase
MTLRLSRVHALSLPRPAAGIVVPGALALAVGLWDLGGPPPWRDEAATASAVARTVPQMLDLLQKVDAVHGAYYALMHIVVTLFGVGDVVLRLPSVLAGMLAAAGLGALGRSLGNARAGLYGGLLLAVMPIFSRYVQEARPYGFTMAAAIGATLLLVRAVRVGQRRAFLVYGLALAGLAYLNLFAFLVAGAHGIYVLSVRGPFRRWCDAVALAAVAIGPLAWMASGQRGQVGWIGPPSEADLGMLAIRMFGDLGEPGSTWLGIAPLVGALALLGIARCRAGGDHARDQPDGTPSPHALDQSDGTPSPHAVDGPDGLAFSDGGRPGGAVSSDTRDHSGHVESPRAPDQSGGAVVRLTLPWILVPPLTLLVVSWTVHPYYVYRYVLCCVPAAALLAGAGLAAIPRRAAVTLFAITVGLTVPSQLVTRGPDGRSDNPDPLAAVVDAVARPGDAVLFMPPRARKFALMYPAAFGRLNDVSLRRSPGRDGSFDGREFGRRMLPAHLAGVRTVWLLGVTAKMKDTDWRFDLLRSSFVHTGQWTSRGMIVARYQSHRSPSPVSHSLPGRL